MAASKDRRQRRSPKGHKRSHSDSSTATSRIDLSVVNKRYMSACTCVCYTVHYIEHLCWLARCLRWCISGGINNQSPSSPQHRPEYPSGSQFTTKGIGISLVPSPILIPSTCARSQKQKVTTGTAWERGSTIISITASFPVSDLQYLLGRSLGMRLASQILRTRC